MLLRSLFTGAALVALCAAACGVPHVAQRGRGTSQHSESSADTAAAAVAPTPALLARLESMEVTESSGIVASRRNPGLFWTHNDSGDGPFIYAFDRRGRSRGVWRVAGARAEDWEDIACGPGPVPGQNYIYAGDTGDNNKRREQVVVYRFVEPKIADPDAATTRADARTTETAEAVRLKYPDGPHDAEALLVHPVSGDIYVVTKAVTGAGVYKLGASDYKPGAGARTLALVATLRGPDFFGQFVTGGDISPDGRRVALCDYAQGYELRLPAAARDFDEVWRQTPAVVPLGARRQGESVCYRLDGAALLATSEGEHPPLYEVTLPVAR